MAQPAGPAPFCFPSCPHWRVQPMPPPSALLFQRRTLPPPPVAALFLFSLRSCYLPLLLPAPLPFLIPQTMNMSQALLTRGRRQETCGRWYVRRQVGRGNRRSCGVPGLPAVLDGCASHRALRVADAAPEGEGPSSLPSGMARPLAARRASGESGGFAHHSPLSLASVVLASFFWCDSCVRATASLSLPCKARCWAGQGVVAGPRHACTPRVGDPAAAGKRRKG